MLKVRSLKVNVLDPISFDLDKGECLVLLGPSGSGKSLLLRAIADLDPVDGELFFEEKERQEFSGSEWRQRIRYAAAEPGWWTERLVDHFKDLDMAKRLAGRLGLTKDIFQRPVSRLSTGERQRLAFARAIEDDPAILLLDEPTGALDAKATERVEALVKERLGQGTSVILVSHDPKQAEKFADRRLLLDNGTARMEVS